MPFVGDGGGITVRFIRVYFLEADVHDGDYTPTRTVTEEYVDCTITQVIEWIRREGLTFEATGNTWAADPDGSFTSNYADGERCAVTAHIGETANPWDLAAIIAGVDWKEVV